MIFGALMEAIDLAQLSGSTPIRPARRSATSSNEIIAPKTW